MNVDLLNLMLFMTPSLSIPARRATTRWLCFSRHLKTHLLIDLYPCLTIYELEISFVWAKYQNNRVPFLLPVVSVIPYNILPKLTRCTKLRPLDVKVPSKAKTLNSSVAQVPSKPPILLVPPLTPMQHR